MTQRLPLGFAILPLLLGSGVAGAQSNSEELLARAISMYEEVQIERALTLLRSVVSPGTPYEVSRSQRVRAYTYIGAALALQNQRDSAIVYFRAALERDPFTDLDRREFTGAELGAFEEAKRRVFALGLRLDHPDTLDPRAERLPFTVVTTHEADVAATIFRSSTDAPEPVFSGTVNGFRELPWNGVRPNGVLIAEGRYEMMVVGTSRHVDRADTARTWFHVSWVHEPLEDTVPSFGAGDLLPERYPPGASRRELGKGLLLAATALGLSELVGSRTLSDDQRLAATTAGVTIGAGIWGFIALERRGTIPRNVEANARLIAQRAARNAAIAARNARRLLDTRLVVVPVAGLAPES